MNEVLAALMLWISANTAYDTTGMPLPEVIEMTPQELTAEYYTDAPQLMPAKGVDERIQALYSIEEGPHGRVYILDADLVPGAADGDDAYDNPLFREMLLHELVHHVQHVSGVADSYLCPAQGEVEAYRVGGVYLKQVHADDPMPNRAFWAHMYSRC
ncbi:hypothetical protein [Tropicimonas sp. S265A]|uniref:hypothetical protein n=1 Tax=Tropicimonas sp. S265A TaxID=3415134 RepID=UPI003C7ADABF